MKTPESSQEKINKIHDLTVDDDVAVVATDLLRRPEVASRAMTDHTAWHVDLVGACSVFVASVGRVLPTLRGHRFTQAERATIATNVARVRSTADWIETSVETGQSDHGRRAGEDPARRVTVHCRDWSAPNRSASRCWRPARGLPAPCNR